MHPPLQRRFKWILFMHVISQYIKVTKYLTDKPSDLKTIGLSLPVEAGDCECIQMDSDGYVNDSVNLSI